jgi:hypothetical protein
MGIIIGREPPLVSNPAEELIMKTTWQGGGAAKSD